MNLTITPSYWNPEWLERQKRNRKNLYPNEQEKEEKESLRKEKYQHKKEEEAATKEENKKKFEIWFQTKMDSFDPNYQPKKSFESYSTFLVKDDTWLKLYNKVSRKFKIAMPNKDISKLQQRYLLDILAEEEKQQYFKELSEKRKKEDERRRKQEESNKIYRKKEKEKQAKWIEWYKQACKVELKPKSFKNESSAKKAEKRDLNKMKEMGFFRYIFHHWDSLDQFSNLSNSELNHLYRVKVEEDKIAKKQKSKEKVVSFIEKEKKLKLKCTEAGVKYVVYEKLPSKHWTESSKWENWSDKDKKRIVQIKENLKQSALNKEWQKLSEQQKLEIVEFRKNMLQLEKEKFKNFKYEERSYRPIVERKDIYYSSTGHSLTIDPSWNSERRMEEIQKFNEGVRDF